jgi:hypothetical protein
VLWEQALLWRRLGDGGGVCAEASGAVVRVFFPTGCRICDKLLTRASSAHGRGVLLRSFAAPPEKKCAIRAHTLAWMTVREAEPPWWLGGRIRRWLRASRSRFLVVGTGSDQRGPK